MWCNIKKKEVTKHQEGKSINKTNDSDNSKAKKDLEKVLQFIIDLLYDPADPYLKNKKTNDMYRLFAEENKVTNLKSFFDELKWRWYATPGLGGKPETPPTPPMNPLGGLNALLEYFDK